MKKKLLLIAFIGVLSAMLYAYQSGAAVNGGIDGTKASGGNGGCGGGGCHNSGTTDSVKVELDSAGVSVASYHPGMAYTVKLSAINGSTTSLTKFGFQLTAVKASTAGTSSAVDAGTWGSMPTNVQNTAPGSSGLPETIIEQRRAITCNSGGGAHNSTYLESIPWTAPVAGTGSVKLFAVMNELSSQSTSKYQVATSVTITEATSNIPVAAVTIAITNGTNPICSGVPVVFTATPTNGGTVPTYQWVIGGTNVGTGPTYTTSTLINGQAVTCVMTSNLSGVSGSPATSNAIDMGINVAPVPTVSQQGNLLISSVATTYQWLMGGSALQGATSQSYTTTQSGSYAVQITDVNGCIATSSATVIGASGISEIALSNALSIYPNPTNGTIQMDIASNLLGGDVRIYDYNGRIVYTGKADFFNNSLTFNASSGIYLVEINKGGICATKKIVKL